MKQLTCEMCGSTDLMKDGGVFVCQKCGCKYSVEEAKKMMVEGVVKVDRTENVKKFLDLAKEALDSQNFPNAEEYANKALEIDPEAMQAWRIKGKAIDWQSTIQNDRTLESMKSYMRYAETLCSRISEYPSTDLCIEVVPFLQELRDSALAHAKLFIKPFSSSYSRANLITDAIPDRVECRCTVMRFVGSHIAAPEGYDLDKDPEITEAKDPQYRKNLVETKTGVLEKTPQLAASYIKDIYVQTATECCSAAVHGTGALVKAWTKINPFEYWVGGGSVDTSNEGEQFSICRQGFDDAIGIVKTAVVFLGKEEVRRWIPRKSRLDALKSCCDTIATLEEQVIDLKSTRTSRSSYGTSTGVGYSLTDAAKESRRKIVEAYRKAAEELGDPYGKADAIGREQFWSENAEKKIRSMRIPMELDEAAKQRKEKESQLLRLGIFKRKERNSLLEEIGELAQTCDALKQEQQSLEEEADEYAAAHRSDIAKSMSARVYIDKANVTQAIDAAFFAVCLNDNLAVDDILCISGNPTLGIDDFNRINKADKPLLIADSLTQERAEAIVDEFKHSTTMTLRVESD